MITDTRLWMKNRRNEDGCFDYKQSTEHPSAWQRRFEAPKQVPTEIIFPIMNSCNISKTNLTDINIFKGMTSIENIFAKY